MSEINVHIEPFRPLPDEVIVARVDARLTPAAAEHIRDTLKELYPNHRVAVLDAGIDLLTIPAEALGEVANAQR